MHSQIKTKVMCFLLYKLYTVNKNNVFLHHDNSTIKINKISRYKTDHLNIKV